MPKSKKTDPHHFHSNPPGGFAGHTPQAESSPPEVKKINSSEVISTLKANGKGWTDDIAEMLSIPQKLFMMRTDSGTFYSTDERFGMSGIMSLGPGPLKAQKTDYGIALYSTGGSVYFVLADIGRKIIVRERLFCIHDDPPEKDWSKVKERIASALSAAAEEKEGSVIISDQQLRKAKLAG
jgi:hypothetical protein